MHLTSQQLETALVTQTGMEYVVVISSELVIAPAEKPPQILIVSISTLGIALNAPSTLTVPLMDLVFASRTGVTNVIVQNTTESAIVDAMVAATDQVMTNVVMAVE